MNSLFRNRDREIRTFPRRNAAAYRSVTASAFGVRINALKPLVPWLC